MSRCPSQDWDRYIASMDGPYHVGKPFVGKSRQDQQCLNCYGNIPAGTAHRIHFIHDEDGHFTSPDRTHLPGECLPLVYDKDLEEWVYAKPEQVSA